MNSADTRGVVLRTTMFQPQQRAKLPKFEGSQNEIIYFKQFCTDLIFKNAQYKTAPMLSAEWHRGE